MIEQASLVIGEGNWAVKSDSLLGYKINGGKYYPREMSVVRATTGTRINEDGLVELVPYNLYSKSNDFSTWGNIVNVTVTPNYTTSPEGTQNASRFQALAYGFIFNLGTTATVGEPITISVYAKRNDSGTQSVGFFQGDSAIEYAFSLTNEWQRFEYTTNFLNDYIGIAANSGADISIYGFQIVQGSSALDYLPTTDRLDVARIDYSSGSGALLVEPQRSNRLLYSEQFDISSYWGVNAGVTISSSVAISPSGILNADRYIESTPNNNAYQLAINSSGTFSASIYVKKASSSNIGFGAVGPGFSGGMSVKFNLDNQTFDTPINYGNFTSITSSYEALDNGWYRITLSGTTLTSDSYYFVIGSLQDTTYTANTYIWGAQFEVGSYQTSYIPTQAATVTRNADVISKTGIADLIGQTEGVVFLDYLYTELDINGNIPITIGLNGTNAAYIYFRNNGVIRCDFIVGAAAQGRIDTPSSYSVKGTRYKIAFAYKANDFTVYINGQLIGTDNSGAITGLSDLFLNYPYNSGFNATSNINAVALYKTRLTNAELATLTTI